MLFVPFIEGDVSFDDKGGTVLFVLFSGGRVELVPLVGGMVSLELGGGGVCAKTMENSSMNTTILTF